MTDWAPYQSSPPEAVRQQSGYFSPIASPRPSTSSPPLLPTHHNPWSPDNTGPSTGSYSAPNAGGREYVNHFETSLPIRLDFEAVMAYVLLPPAGGVLLLLLEHKSDYVRYHAWQSALVFTVLFVLHIIFSFAAFLSYTLLLVDLGLIGYLSFRAYKDADTLERFELPYFGALANSFVDEE